MESISVAEYSKNKYFLHLVDFSARSKLHKIITKLGGSWVDSELEPGWIFPKNGIDDLKNELREFNSKGNRRKNSSQKKRESRSRSSVDRKSRDRDERSRGDSRRSESRLSSTTDSDTDDELIQKALARRIMSESSQKSIEATNIENSDNEDCVSFSRRLRHLYGVIEKLNNRLLALESR